MASLVEFQDYKLNQQPIFPDPSDLQVLEDLLGGMELPTPPLSPDHDPTVPAGNSCSTQLTCAVQGQSQEKLDQTDLDVGETILQQIMESENMLFDSQGTYCSDTSDILDVDPSILTNPQALLQDCMWNCDAYEPRHSISCNGIYTPAPSPPPEAKDLIQECEEEQAAATFNMDKSTEEEAECISPNEVLVFSGGASSGVESATSKDGSSSSSSKSGRKLNREARRSYRRCMSSVSSSSSRIHPQATSSESEEEIDVVTITDRPETLNRVGTRKQPRTTSISAPCSRQTSPTPRTVPPTKKRRCHSKRTHRLSSAGSNYGDGMDSDDEQRRASHNVLERKRRNDLKSSFQILRGQIPELEDNQRAPKVTILRKAAEYIKQIRDKEEDMQSRMAVEKRRETRLLQRLAYLKSLP